MTYDPYRVQTAFVNFIDLGALHWQHYEKIQCIYCNGNKLVQITTVRKKLKS